MKTSLYKEVLRTMILSGLPVLVKSSPGVGKTDIAFQVAEELDYDMILTHPVVSDPTDYKGLPFVVDGRADFLPIGDLELALKAKKPTIFFLDDLGQAPATVQAAAMQLILARRINGHKIPDCVTFMAATNRKADKAGVTSILEPVKSRFATIIEVEPDVDDWTKDWAFQNKMPTELIAFIQWRPTMLNSFVATADITNTPSPRTVANSGKIINKWREQKYVPEPDVEMEVLSGAAGEGFAVELIGFLRVAEALPDPELALQNPRAVTVPGEDRLDVLYAFCGSVAYRVSKKNMKNFIILLEQMPPEFQAVSLKMACGRDPDLKETKHFIEWVSNNEDLLF